MRRAGQALAGQFVAAEAGGTDMIFVVAKREQFANGVAGEAHIHGAAAGAAQFVAVEEAAQFADMKLRARKFTGAVMWRELIEGETQIAQVAGREADAAQELNPDPMRTQFDGALAGGEELLDYLG